MQYALRKSSMPFDSIDTPLISVNLGRNRTTASLVTGDGSPVAVIVDGADGIITRWVGDGPTQRITDHLIDLVDSDLIIEATDLCSRLASMIIPADSGSTPTIISVPAAFGPICRSVVKSGFSRHCRVTTMVARPLASAAYLVATIPQLDEKPSLIIDNDGGEISVLALDPGHHTAFPPTPISTGPSDNQVVVAERLHAYIRDVSSMLPTDELVVKTDRISVSNLFSRVVLSGPGSQEPQLRAFVSAELPGAEVLQSRSARPCDDTLALSSIDQTWAAGWPTAETSITGNRLSFLAANGEPHLLNVGSVLTSSIRIPKDLASDACFRTLADGRLLVKGKPGRRPLTMKVRWPLMSGGPTELRVEALGTRPLEAIDGELSPPSVSGLPLLGPNN